MAGIQKQCKWGVGMTKDEFLIRVSNLFDLAVDPRSSTIFNPNDLDTRAYWCWEIVNNISSYPSNLHGFMVALAEGRTLWRGNKIAKSVVRDEDPAGLSLTKPAGAESEPEYEPWSWDSRCKIPDTVVAKKTGHIYIVVSIAVNRVTLKAPNWLESSHTYDALLHGFLTPDGRPCGMEVSQ